MQSNALKFAVVLAMLASPSARAQGNSATKVLGKRLQWKREVGSESILSLRPVQRPGIGSTGAAAGCSAGRSGDPAWIPR